MRSPGEWGKLSGYRQALGLVLASLSDIQRGGQSFRLSLTHQAQHDSWCGLPLWVLLSPSQHSIWNTKSFITMLPFLCSYSLMEAKWMSGKWERESQNKMQHGAKMWVKDSFSVAPCPSVRARSDV